MNRCMNISGIESTRRHRESIPGPDGVGRMRLGILSDIHGNRHALEAVLIELDAQGIDRLICLGDVVGYGPEPEACLDLLIERRAIVILGNHEEAVLEPRIANGFRDAAREAIAWTRRRLRRDRPDLMKYLGSLPGMAYLGAALMCVHDSPTPSGPRYLVTGQDAVDAFTGVDVPVCLVGHTHLPTAFRCFGSGSGEQQEIHVEPRSSLTRIQVDATQRWILNPGSVGQPRDGDPRASYATIDLTDGMVEWARVAYDISAAQRHAIDAGLPVRSAERLAVGA